jgi:hypothetical protein
MTRSRRSSERDVASGLSERPQADFLPNQATNVIDDASFESLVTTAILATTAFRLRDQDGLTMALRLLVEAVRPFEADMQDR